VGVGPKGEKDPNIDRKNVQDTVESSHTGKSDLEDGIVPQRQVLGLPASRNHEFFNVSCFLKSNLGTRFHLRGVGCDAPGFYLTLIVSQIC
jgi:hypothetical protein